MEIMGIFNKIFSSAPKLEPADLSVLRCDIHSHLIPGIDDGVQTMEESLQIIKYFSTLGYKKIITTPHIIIDYYKNTSEIILNGLEKVRAAVKEAGIDIEIDASAEYYCDLDLEEKIAKKDLIAFGNNYILFELPFLSAPENMSKVIFELQTNGYKPILAHPERYTFYYKDFQKYYDLKDRGVLFQMNINSLTGHYSLDTKKIAERMIDEGMIDLIGSDCHNTNHLILMERARKEKYLHKLLEKPDLLNMSL
ncbi:MAG: capsular biosynthesis protein [Bacteroidetes bacterium]|nr:capsular biosynthesis protein [Bacteroidota bacterium]